MRTPPTFANLLAMDDVERARAKIADTLEQALDGRVTFIEAAREVNRLVDAAGFQRLSAPFITFVGIDSETDHIPLGKVREQWAPEAVARNKADWDSAEAWARQFGEEACREALALVRCT